MHSAGFLVATGALFLIGLALDKIGRQAHVPRVTLLILLGTVLGPSAFGLLPQSFYDASDLLTPVALTMVAFLLGSTLNRDTLAAHGREIFTISLAIVMCSILIVTGGLVLWGLPAPLALLFGGIAVATDPAATTDVIRQTGAKGRLVTNITGIVAIDDAWGVLAFAITLAAAGILMDGTAGNHLLHGLREIFGAVALGLAIGLPASVLTGRITIGEPTRIEALGLVFLCAGLALWFKVSFLLTGIICGATIVNFAQHHERPFHEIERLEWPFLLLFFVLAGAALDLGAMSQVATLTIAFIAFRMAARLFGGTVGGLLAGRPAREGALTGLALMPQAGVALGMALMVRDRYPEFGENIVTVTLAATIFFELAGPFLTLFALNRAAKSSNPHTD